jgi:hypothetical protein
MFTCFSSIKNLKQIQIQNSHIFTQLMNTFYDLMTDITFLCFFLVVGALVRGCFESTNQLHLEWWHRPVKLAKKGLGPLLGSSVCLGFLYVCCQNQICRFFTNPTLSDIGAGFILAVTAILGCLALSSALQTVWIILQPSSAVVRIPRNRQALPDKA